MLQTCTPTLQVESLHPSSISLRLPLSLPAHMGPNPPNHPPHHSFIYLACTSFTLLESVSSSNISHCT